MRRQLMYNIFFPLLVILSFQLNAQQPVNISLGLNYSSSQKLYHNEPLLLTVTITNREAQENNRWNRAIDRRLNEMDDLLKENIISAENYENEKNQLNAVKRPVPSITLGSQDKPWSSLVKWKMINSNTGTEIVLPVTILSNPFPESIAILDEKGYYISYFGISPQDMKQIRGASTWQLTATMGSERSNDIRLEIKEEIMPMAIAETEEMWLRIGQYYWHANNAENTIQFADRILKKNPLSLDGLSLKADGLILQKSYLPALEVFNKALTEYYKQNGVNSEPPEYLVESIAWIKKQLGQ